MAAMIEQRASAKGLSVRIEADSLPERLFGDAERLSQALLNYAANAVKFTEAGSITLKARTIEDGESSCLVRIEVVDTGIGIAPEAQGAYSSLSSRPTAPVPAVLAEPVWGWPLPVSWCG